MSACTNNFKLMMLMMMMMMVMIMMMLMIMLMMMKMRMVLKVLSATFLSTCCSVCQFFQYCRRRKKKVLSVLQKYLFYFY